MNFELKIFNPTTVTLEKCDACVVLVANSFTTGKDALSVLVAKALTAADLLPKPGSTLDIYRPPGFSTKRVVLVHIGEGNKADVCKGVVAAFSVLKAARARHLVVSCMQQPTSQLIRALVITIADASYVYTTTKSDKQGRSLEKIVIAVPDDKPLLAGFKRATAAVNGIELAKEWGNRPANFATPTHLAGVAKAMSKFARIKVEILDPKDVAKLGMGAFEAVAKGSDEPLRFIVMQYSGAAKSKAPAVLVGKGITFDSGGISIKPAAEMDEMKFDMCGAASVLGVFRALAELKPKINVVGLIASCENLLSGRSVKPGDVVTSMSGQTIEVLNTDAEGRLVLCDALTYAERFKPSVVLDIATLTGACVIALGGVRSGVFSSDEQLSAALVSAGESSQDLCWLMPLDDDYAEGLKTSFADVANLAGRAGGAITAAKFLQRFTSKYRWAHLDIAGTAWKSGVAKGATGRPVGLLLDYLLDQDVKGAVV
jgi:leucyl aminopeptidase